MATEQVLERWRELDASMDGVRAVKALREAVHALEVIQPLGGIAGEMAGAAILRVRDELTAEVDLDEHAERLAAS